MIVHGIAPLFMVSVYVGSIIFSYPAYLALVAYVLCYVVYYAPRIIMNILEFIGDVLCDIGDIFD